MATTTGTAKLHLELDGVPLDAELAPKEFSSGSKGFYLQAKGGPQDADRPGGKGAGPRYRVQVTVTRIGTKG